MHANYNTFVVFSIMGMSHRQSEDVVEPLLLFQPAIHVVQSFNPLSLHVAQVACQAWQTSSVSLK